jgi:hypothetical protein
MTFPEPVTTEPLLGKTIGDFLKFVSLDEASGCWLWIGYCNEKRGGYGYFDAGKGPDGRTVRAHRIAYQCFRGPIKDHLDHLCLVTNCVNPWHLEDVPNKENHRRRMALRTHCNQGHPYPPAGEVTIDRNGSRVCVPYNRARSSKSYYASQRGPRMAKSRCRCWRPLGEGRRGFCEHLRGHAGEHLSRGVTWLRPDRQAADELLYGKAAS